MRIGSGLKLSPLAGRAMRFLSAELWLPEDACGPYLPVMASVLIVEDDRDNCDVLDRFLRKSGHETDCAPNGREAISMLVRRRPDVIVLDVNMPEMDGVSLLQVLRSYLRWNRLPVVLVTGAATLPQLREAEELGIRGVFVKGEYRLKDLLACIEQAVSSPVAPGCGPSTENPYLSN